MYFLCGFNFFPYFCSDSISLWTDLTPQTCLHSLITKTLTPKLWSSESRGKFTCILPSRDKGGTMFNGVGMRVAIY